MSLRYILSASSPRRSFVASAMACGLLALTACEEEVDEPIDNTSTSGTSTEPPVTTTSSDTSSTSTSTQTSTVTDFDPFANAQQAWHFEVSEDQRKRMDEGLENGDDQYPPPGGDTHADKFVLTLADGQTITYGKTALKSIGQSSRRDWAHIPNLRLDADEFQKGLRYGGYEHLRLNNGQVGGIFREHIALRTWEKLGYLAPRTQFTRVTSNVWGEDVFVPYTLVEVYKRSFCDRTVPGGCVNMWEGQGEPDQLVGACQVEECDDTRLLEYGQTVSQTAIGDGFMQALDTFIDWPRFQQFMCLSWMTATGDDYVHNLNNTVILERDDGKFVFLPYSTDISAGQSWYQEVSLIGTATLARGCAFDRACWTGLLSTCNSLLDQWDKIGPAALVEESYVTLEANNLLRKGDDSRYEELRNWYGMRSAKLRASDVWGTLACLDDSQCVDAPNGQTRCNTVDSLCKVPCVSEADCPQDKHCSSNTQTCEAGEAPDDLGDRYNPGWMDPRVDAGAPLALGDEDCVGISWEPMVGVPHISSESPDCSDAKRSDTMISIYNLSGELIATNDNIAEGNYCSAIDAPPDQNSIVVCVHAADSAQALDDISLRIEFGKVEGYAIPLARGR